MYSWQRKAGVLATLIALLSVTACAADPVGASSTPQSAASAIAGQSDAACAAALMDVRRAAYWYSRVSTDLEGVALPQPDCIRDGRHGDVTLIWLESNPGLLLTILSAFKLAGWYETGTSSDLVSFISPLGTSVSASYVRSGYDDSEAPYVALVYVRSDISAAPGTPGWEN